MDFANWKNWKEVKFTSGKIGIYIIAFSKEDLMGKPFSWDTRKIIYIGMTNKQGVKVRLNQFDNTLHGKIRHGGADRVWGEHHSLGYENFVKDLYFSTWEFNADYKRRNPEDLRIMGQVALAEYLCFANYLEQFGELPQFNDESTVKYSKIIR